MILANSKLIYPENSNKQC